MYYSIIFTIKPTLFEIGFSSKILQIHLVANWISFQKSPIQLTWSNLILIEKIFAYNLGYIRDKMGLYPSPKIRLQARVFYYLEIKPEPSRAQFW